MTKSNADETTAHDDASSEQDGLASEHEMNDEFSALQGLRESARIAKDALRDACRGASVTATELGEDAYRMGARTGARITRQVEAQPMASVLVAGSLGLIAGVLLARR